MNNFISGKSVFVKKGWLVGFDGMLSFVRFINTEVSLLFFFFCFFFLFFVFCGRRIRYILSRNQPTRLGL